MIGRNGVGKTRYLANIVKCLASAKKYSAEYGIFSFSSGQSFSNIVSVTFSAFDRFIPPPKDQRAGATPYWYVGLKTLKESNDTKRIVSNEELVAHKTIDDLNAELLMAVQELTGSKLKRWKEAIETLETDSLFRDSGIEILYDGNKVTESIELIKKLSSGHNIVLLTIAKLVELVDENTLVVLDEPEAHLHPPLLSAFIRALSNLLKQRNGVAIIATHSPVVLQEVPRSCVWIMHRSGSQAKVNRPSVETFGENVGVLTREVFNLEVTKSGYHTLLEEYLPKINTIDEFINLSSDQLGAEAIAISIGLLNDRRRAPVESKSGE